MSSIDDVALVALAGGSSPAAFQSALEARNPGPDVKPLLVVRAAQNTTEQGPRMVDIIVEKLGALDDPDVVLRAARAAAELENYRVFEALAWGQPDVLKGLALVLSTVALPSSLVYDGMDPSLVALALAMNGTPMARMDEAAAKPLDGAHVVFAAIYNDLDRLDTVLALGADIHFDDDAAFVEAARHRNPAMLRALVDRGIMPTQNLVWRAMDVLLQEALITRDQTRIEQITDTLRVLAGWEEVGDYPWNHAFITKNNFAHCMAVMAFALGQGWRPSWNVLLEIVRANSTRPDAAPFLEQCTRAVAEDDPPQRILDVIESILSRNAPLIRDALGEVLEERKRWSLIRVAWVGAVVWKGRAGP